MTEEIIIDYKKECSNLLAEKNALLCRYEEIREQLSRLEQENKELKEMLSKEPKAMQAFQIAYSGLKKDNEVLWGMVKDYKTALEEIRVIADDTFKVCDDNCGNARKIKLIIDKINEVLTP